jgi:hypothetical protein
MRLACKTIDEQQRFSEKEPIRIYIYFLTIPKTGEKSFSHIHANGHHCILYIGNPKNLNVSKNEEPYISVEGIGGFLI